MHFQKILGWVQIQENMNPTQMLKLQTVTGLHYIAQCALHNIGVSNSAQILSKWYLGSGSHINWVVNLEACTCWQAEAKIKSWNLRNVRT